jgi:hypothetical protein
MFDTQQEAVESGRKAAHSDEPSQLVVHGADGGTPPSRAAV